MAIREAKIVVAGHICLDIIPTFPLEGAESAASIEPGHLYVMGPVVCATGGSVSNTGLALHRLGVPITLVGKVGNDLFGGEVLNILRRLDPALADGMIVSEGENTSYSIVISPPNVDRSFLHCPGANDTFTATDIDPDRLTGAQLLHFGYPPIMEQFYGDGGRQMSDLLQQVQGRGLVTSLDLVLPDPQSPAGRIDWRAWLERVLPAVDVFLPSIDEILYMLHRDRYEEQSRAPGTDLIAKVDPALLHDLADQLLAMGTAVVVLKLGAQGLYLRSSANVAKLSDTQPIALEKSRGWNHRELIAPCFEVEVAGTTGAGDCSIAGFLAAICDGANPEEALTRAVAVGASCVEATDATSGVCPWIDIRRRIASGWRRRPSDHSSSGWQWHSETGVWAGPCDGMPPN